MKTRSPSHDRTLDASPAHTDASSPAQEAGVEHKAIRRLIWVYFWLLLIEGALRKWIFPQWSTPLLVVRDPVVMLIYFLALARGIFPWNAFLYVAVPLGVASAIASLFTDQFHMLVTAYGLRCSFMYLPLIFLIPKVFDLRDVEKIGAWLLLSAIPMALLVVVQFRSSPNAWVNVGVAGAEGTQLTVGFGKIRPPGTFSFTSGLACYLTLVSAFVFSWLIKRDSINPKIAYAAIPATGIMIGVSGSRGLLTAVTLILAGMTYVCLRKRMFFGKGVRAGFVIALVFFALQFRQEFRQGMIIFEDRITGSGGVREGLVYRALGGFIEPFKAVAEVPLFGEGIGLGTTVAGGLIYGERKFLLAEDEWSRIVRESGPILGFAYLALRVTIVILLFRTANRALQAENPLPMLLVCASSPSVLVGQWGVSTLLGFAAFTSGISLAAARLPRVALAVPAAFRVSPGSATNMAATVRGRSVYAEKLHGR